MHRRCVFWVTVSPQKNDFHGILTEVCHLSYGVMKCPLTPPNEPLFASTPLFLKRSSAPYGLRDRKRHTNSRVAVRTGGESKRQT